MAQKRSRKARREAQGHAKKQRRLRIAGFAGILILMVAAFVILRGDDPGTESAAAGSSVAPEVGALAPDFQLATIDGEQVQLSDFRGRPVAVTFMHTW
jgi:cytochrome oxidase Cu insertion factor (SCO1/SenC/PrrC family)